VSDSYKNGHGVVSSRSTPSRQILRLRL